MVDGRETVYALSNALARFALGEIQPEWHGQKTPAGVVYPSIATNTFGDNAAIRPEYLDSAFHFVGAVWLEVLNIIDGVAIKSHSQPVARCHVSEVGFADED
jgi:hypothetical protein